MNKRYKISVLVLLGTIALAACATASQPTTSSDAVASFDGQKLNLNTVTGDELLATIPDFPNRMVREFQEYRPYVSIQQFRHEIGKYVGDAQVVSYEQYVYVPISFNSSDVETLGQIPGLDTTEVETLISTRPFVSQENFLTQLGQYVSADELEIAKSYLGTN